ncbi:MAG: UDP-N-acetylmuramate dehydrogenase, partial [Cyclobacteriaceae bacterium]|nr:UDP-N-acetylmuramate dehydrogenase [Cyclobacteriaceae bacterium]
MISLREHVSLQSLNTFGIEARARFFVEVTRPEDMIDLWQHPVYHQHQRLILGGGSNVLLTRDFDGLVIKNAIKGQQVRYEDAERVDLTIAGGEEWHALVVRCVAQRWGGIENLALIPGTVGAAPIQNIGAYGVELQEVVHTVHGIDLSRGIARSFDASECRFGYRDSIFKHAWKEKFFISSVTLTLTKKNHVLRTHYGAIDETLKKKNQPPTIHSICDAVIEIRSHKLPDPAKLGNAGSFFKNPSIDLLHFEKLQRLYPSIPNYPTENQLII